MHLRALALPQGRLRGPCARRAARLHRGPRATAARRSPRLAHRFLASSRACQAPRELARNGMPQPRRPQRFDWKGGLPTPHGSRRAPRTTELRRTLAGRRQPTRPGLAQRWRGRRAWPARPLLGRRWMCPTQAGSARESTPAGRAIAAAAPAASVLGLAPWRRWSSAPRASKVRELMRAHSALAPRGRQHLPRGASRGTHRPCRMQACFFAQRRARPAEGARRVPQRRRG